MHLERLISMWLAWMQPKVLNPKNNTSTTKYIKLIKHVYKCRERDERQRNVKEHKHIETLRTHRCVDFRLFITWNTCKIFIKPMEWIIACTKARQTKKGLLTLKCARQWMHRDLITIFSVSFFSFVFIIAPHQLTIAVDALHLSAVSSFGWWRERKRSEFVSTVSLVIYGWAAIGLCEISFFIYNLLPWTVRTRPKLNRSFNSAFFLLILNVCIELLLVMLSIHAIIRFFSLFFWNTWSMFHVSNWYENTAQFQVHAATQCVRFSFFVYFRSNDSHMLRPIANTPSEFLN